MDDPFVLDPDICPECATQIVTGSSRCPQCGIALFGPPAVELWTVSAEILRLAARRRVLLRQMRATPDEVPQAPEVAAPAPVADVVLTPMSAADRAPAWAFPTASTVPPWQPSTPRPRQEWNARTVQNLLLSLGVLLLAVAGTIFIATKWSELGVGPKSLVLGGLTAGLAWGGHAALRRELPATAEALALLAVGFLLLDAYAVRRVGLGGTDALSGASYWASATAVTAALSAAYGSLVGIRGPRYAALAVGQLPLLITAGQLDANASRTLVLALQVAGLAAVAALARGRRWAFGIEEIAVASAGLTWLAGLGFGLEAAYNTSVRLDTQRGAVVLLLLAVVAVGAAAIRPELEVARVITTGAATAAAVLAVIAPLQLEVTDDQVPLVIAAAGLLSIVGTGLLRPRWRTGPLSVAVIVTSVSVLAVLPDVFLGLVGPFGWLAEPWSGVPHESREALSPELPWGGTVITLVVMAVAAFASAIAGELADRRRRLMPLTITAATVALLLVPLGQAWPYTPAIAWYVVLAVGGTAAGAWVQRRSAKAAVWLSGVAFGVGAIVLAWSFADRDTTLVVLGILVVTYLGAAVVDRMLRLPAAGIATALGCGWVAVAGSAVGGNAEQAALATGLTGCALVLGGGLLRVVSPAGLVVQAVAASAFVLALLASATDAGMASWLLLAGALAAFAEAVHPDRRLAAWVGATLLNIWSWVRLAILDVELPEAYALPVAATVLLLGYLRRRGNNAVGSWEAYGAGLAVGLGSTLFVTLMDSGLTRPLLLAGTAAVVVLLGANRRLQAPIVLGGVALAVDAVVQVGPVVVDWPRWITLGSIGAILLVVAATYEQRRRDVRRLSDAFERLD